MQRFRLVGRPRNILLAMASCCLLLGGCSGSATDQAVLAQEQAEIERLRKENLSLAQLRSENEEVRRLRKENQEIFKLRAQYQEWLRLRKENEQLKSQLSKAQQVAK
ncbi:MAG: hypothetical protein HY735_23585 [Verrucomicrobia bacterium]|nr:hypothetical protein [Verrucomicrobiota bacterium]